MWNLFSDLKNLGIKGLDETELYDTEEAQTRQAQQRAEQENRNTQHQPVVHAEEEFIFDKKYLCPVCGKNFVSKAVRTGKSRLISSDMDLKPNYNDIEPIKYDVIVCTNCGYASLGRNFGHITAMQSKLVRENISQSFKGLKSSGKAYYTFEDAQERYELALANALVMKVKNSERAYLCLKLAWLYRYAYKAIEAGSGDASLNVQELKEKESSCIKMAYEGFSISYLKEVPPICGMDSNTLAYLLSDLARQCKDYENAAKYVGSVLTSRVATERIKERGRTEKELIFKEMKNES